MTAGRRAGIAAAVTSAVILVLGIVLVSVGRPGPAWMLIMLGLLTGIGNALDYVLRRRHAPLPRA